jgi:hypothetical protein
MTKRSRDALGFADRTDLFLAVIVTHFAFADIGTSVANLTAFTGSPSRRLIGL